LPSVTFFFAVNSLSGSFQEARRLLMFSSSESLPFSTLFRAAAAVTGLLIEAA
jgi:hypothetical protein